MPTFRVRRHSIEPQGAARRALLEAVEIDVRTDIAILLVGGEPLLMLPSLDEVLVAMDLTPDDVEEKSGLR